MFCTKCGANVADGSLFCTKCGAKLSPIENAGQENQAESAAQDVQAENATQENQVENAAQNVQTGNAAEPAQSVQTGNAVEPAQNVQQGSVWQAAAAAQPSPEQKKKNTGIIIGGIAAFAVLLVIIIVSATILLKPGINLTSEDVVKVEFNGGDGRGNARYNVDYDELEELGKKVLGKKPSDKKSLLWFGFMASISYDIDPDSDLTNGDKVTLSVSWDEKSAKQLGIRVKGKDRKITVADLEKAAEVDVFKSLEVTFEGYNGNGTVDINDMSTDNFHYNVYFEADKDEGLSNGDKIKITANVSDSILDDYNYILKETEKEYTVAGLEEMQTLDLFADLTVEYSGTSPYAKLSLRDDSDEEFINYYVRYEADKRENLKNGDVITVTASVNEDYAADYGYTIGETTKQYTVADLDEYVGSYSDITEDILDKMESQAEDAIDSWISDQEKWNEYRNLKIGKPELYGSCFLKLKDGLTYGWGYNYENAVYMCYKAEKTFKESDRNKKEDVYIIVIYKNFLKYDDGTVYVEIVGASVESTTYATYEDFYEKAIRAKKEDYTVEEIKEKE